MNNEKYKKKSNKLNFIIICLAFIGLIIYMALVDGIDNILNIFANCNFFWLSCGIFIMAFCWFLESYILNVGLNIFGKRLNFKDSAKNCILGQFFCSITPSATGGQPFQAYYMNKCKINYGTSTSVLLIKFICFQISLTLICGVFIFLNFKELTSKIHSFSIVMLTSFAINVVIALFLILIGLNKKIAISITKMLVSFLKKLRIFKNANDKFEKIKSEIEFFNTNFNIIFKNKKTITYIMFLTIIQILSFYTINIAIAYVFRINLTLSQMYKIVVGAACIQMISTFVPLPGAVGGAEVSYCVFYDGIFTAKSMTAALLLWRIYTFYIPIILGLFFYKSFSKKIDSNQIS